MINVIIIILLAVATFVLYRAADVEEEPKGRPPPTDSSFPVPRNNATSNSLTKWDDQWELNARKGSVSFRLEKMGNSSSGLIVALANEWRAAETGGVAIVLGDPVESSVVARNRSYFASMPYYNNPSMQSTTLTNHNLHRNRKYEIKWDEMEIVLYAAENAKPLIRLNRTMSPESVSIRYLAFGAYGVERQPQCNVSENCIRISEVKIN